MNTEDWDRFNLEKLLDSAEKAIAGSRYVFILTIIASVLMAGEIFNANFAWIRNIIHRETISQKELEAIGQTAELGKIQSSHSFPDTNNVAIMKEVLQKELLTIPVPLFNVKFSAFDLPVLGAFGMSVLMLWNVYAVRRERNVVSDCAAEANAAVKASKNVIETETAKKRLWLPRFSGQTG